MKPAIKPMSGTLFLFKNGNSALCPYKQDNVVMSSLGQPQLMPAPCTDQCPHFHFNKTQPDGGVLSISCGTGTRQIQVEYDNSNNKPSIIKGNE